MPQPDALEAVARLAAELALDSRPDPGPRLAALEEAVAARPAPAVPAQLRDDISQLAEARAADGRRLDALEARPAVPDAVTEALAGHGRRLDELEEAPTVPDAITQALAALARRLDSLEEPAAPDPDPATADAVREMGIRLAILEGTN